MDVRKAKSRIAFRLEEMRRRTMKRSIYLIFLAALIFVIFFSAFLILVFERRVNSEISNYRDALWLTFVTMATVGYGDIVPITAGGKVTAIASMVLGIGLLGAVISTIAARRIARLQRRARGLGEKVFSRDHYVVCGWNTRGRFLVSELVKQLEGLQTRIVIVCKLEEKPVDDDSVFFIQGNPVEEKVLKEANVSEAKVAILLADESRGGSSGDVDAKTVLTALTLRSINPDITMTAEVLDPGNTHHLELAGVGEILDPNLFLGSLLARSAIRSGLINTVTDLITREEGQHVFRIPVNKEMAALSGEKLRAHLLEKYGARAIGYNAGRGIAPYTEDTELKEGDVLIVLSEVEPPKIA